MNRRIASLLLTGLFAGCTAGGSLGTAADRLDRTSHDFYRQLEYSSASNHTESDAAALAEAADDFNRQVDRSRSRDSLQPSFDRVAERYHHLRDQLDDHDYYRRYTDAGFDRVTEAYLDVERAMEYPTSSRYHN